LDKLTSLTNFTSLGGKYGENNLTRRNTCDKLKVKKEASCSYPTKLVFFR